ncbi:MAG: hypothetical protein R2854_27805 [Caldilineaceae bacterium]
MTQDSSVGATPFIPGRDLCGAFYHEAVAPLLADYAPGLPHAAALIGSGSEVLGFDDAMSTDHHWGPRVMLFLTEEDHAAHAAGIHELLRQRLPTSFRYSTNFSAPIPMTAACNIWSNLTQGRSTTG